MTLLLKACPRCGGDLFPDASSREAPLFVCLQCGFQPYRRLPTPDVEREASRMRRLERRARPRRMEPAAV